MRQNMKKIRVFLKKFFKLLVLFLLPAIICIYWYWVEYEEFHPFNNFETGGAGIITPDKVVEVNKLTNAFYELTKDKSSFQFDKREEQNSDFGNFKLKVSGSIVEKLGIFSSLPYHQVCLINRNEIFVDNVLDNSQATNIGATAINQKDGYSFYAQRGDKDCKPVLISKFRQSSSSPELGYAFTQKISSEENIKRLKGEDYLSTFATTTVRAANTTISISLKLWAVLAAYFLILFAWSFIFFQYLKIIDYFYKIWRNTDVVQDIPFKKLHNKCCISRLNKSCLPLHTRKKLMK
jgi:hypothetical protein